MNLPSLIQAYFDADRSADSQALVGVFAPDAVVIDERQTYTGREAIGAWRRKAKADFDYVVEPFDSALKDDVTQVRATVTGDFPGSPVTLSYAFRLERGLISSLEITL